MSDPNTSQRHAGAGVGPAGASLSDLLSAVQHVASQIGVIGQRYMNAQGQSLGAAITGPKVLKTTAGRLVMISVTVAGTGPGQIIDATVLSATDPVICIIPDTVGVLNVNLPFTLGLLVVPGPGMTVSVSYS
jgi:hypothetical protein